MKASRAAKAWISAVLAAMTAAGTALEAHQAFTWGDMGITLGAFVAGYQGVYWTRNNLQKGRGNVTSGNLRDDNRPSSGGTI